MRIVRYLKRSGSKPAWGWVSEDRVGRLDSSPFGPYGRKEAKDPLERVRLLPPVEPGKIICIGQNYAAHAAEHDAQVPEQPLIFLKPPSSVIGPGEPILLPPQSENVEHEAELALVIGRGGRWIPPEKAAEHILGYTAANDVTARDLQRIDGQWTRGKGFDTFCPIGPWIETDLDPADVLLIGVVRLVDLNPVQTEELGSSGQIVALHIQPHLVVHMRIATLALGGADRMLRTTTISPAIPGRACSQPCISLPRCVCNISCAAPMVGLSARYRSQPSLYPASATQWAKSTACATWQGRGWMVMRTQRWPARPLKKRWN